MWSVQCGTDRKVTVYMMETSTFAKCLAANTQIKRERSIKKLRKFIGARAAKPGGFSEEELLQLWKGLHYCMWMQDKPLLQEELSTKLCGLLKAFPDGDSALAFAAAFFTTQAREWGRLDQWRMDKFMMLIRDFLHATLEVVNRNHWEGHLVEGVSAMIGAVMDAGKEDFPDGFRLHLADIYLEELEKVGAQKVTGDQINILLEPFVQYIVESKRDTIANRVIAKVFSNILATADREESGPLQFNYQGLRKVLFDAGRQKTILPKVRQKIYKMVKRFSRVCDAGSPLEGSPLQELVQEKRKRPAVALSPGEEKAEPKRKKARKAGAEESGQQPSGTPGANHKVQPQTPVQQKKKHKKETPQSQSTPKHVAFDLQRNSSRDLKDFVDTMVHQPSVSPYLPSRSPTHGILKESPGGSTPTSTSSSGKGGHPVKRRVLKGGSMLAKKEKKTFSVKGGALKKGGKPSSPKGEKASKFVSKKRGKMMKKPKRR